MQDKTFLRANEVADELGVSTATAYKLIRKLNTELEERGFITINGRVNQKFFLEKLYGTDAKAMREISDECV